MSIKIGCIADDITGGTDIALALTSAGLRVVQIFDEQNVEMPVNTDAVVISLKIRTEPVDIAVNSAKKACQQLQSWHVKQIYFKYCSTFDSTKTGNIGPIANMLLAQTKATIVPFCPSFPKNGRTVYQGHLFVFEKLLQHSSMKDHPLTPMTDSHLCNILEAQSPKSVVTGLVPLQTVESGSNAIATKLTELSKSGVNFAIIDAINESHLQEIGRACVDLPLVSGGAALAVGLALNYSNGDNLKNEIANRKPFEIGPVALFSGSCSSASIQQVRHAEPFIKTIRLIPHELSKPEYLETVINQALQALVTGSVLIASTDTPDEVGKAQANTKGNHIGHLIEQAHATVAKALWKSGVHTFIVAGGETSGAIAKSLGLTSLHVGTEISPGVPWMYDEKTNGLRVAFKSGNFGNPTFFLEALKDAKTSKFLIEQNVDK